VGRIGRLLSFIRVMVGSDVKIDRGGEDIRTVEHFSDSGDDSFPLPGDYVQTLNQTGTGRDSAIGYIDLKNQKKATGGEKRIYARDAEGETICEVWLKSTGEVTAFNENGSFTLRPNGEYSVKNGGGSIVLQPNGEYSVKNGGGSIVLQSDGVCNINGLIISVGGNAISSSDISLSTHTHNQGRDSDGNTQVPTNAPNAG